MSASAPVTSIPATPASCKKCKTDTVPVDGWIIGYWGPLEFSFCRRACADAYIQESHLALRLKIPTAQYY